MARNDELEKYFMEQQIKQMTEHTVNDTERLNVERDPATKNRFRGIYYFLFGNRKKKKNR